MNQFPMTVEKQRITQIYRDVEKRLGLHLNMEIVTGAEHSDNTPCSCGKCGTKMTQKERPNIGVTQNRWDESLYRLVYTEGITKHFDTYLLSGIIAHELGHVVLGHVNTDPNPNNERAADDYAARNGFGDALQRVFEHKALEDPEMSWYESNSHPAIQERIWRLRNFNSQERKAA